MLFWPSADQPSWGHGWWLSALILFWPWTTVSAADSFGVWATFNTSCARCHEGQCSGRLSLGADAATQTHVERYSGKILTGDEHALFLHHLRLMKEGCHLVSAPAHAPVDVAVLQAEGAILAAFRSFQGNAYFIPLGKLMPGRYQLILEGTAAQAWRVQVLAETLETSSDSEGCAGSLFLQEAFVAGGMAYHYLRVITGSGNVWLTRLEVRPLP